MEDTAQENAGEEMVSVDDSGDTSNDDTTSQPVAQDLDGEAGDDLDGNPLTGEDKDDADDDLSEEDSDTEEAIAN